FFSGVVEGLKAAFAPVAGIFSPLAPVFDSIIEKLRGVWQWFTDLIAPVKATQETLDSCKNAGVLFGKALADALMLPLNSFNKLRGGVNWLLEKLGVINKESSDLDQKAAKANAATGSGKESSIRPTPLFGDSQWYHPVPVPAGKTYVDQSKPEYNITLHGGIAPGTDLDRQLREAVERLDQQNRARQRSSMRHDG
ncbi:phage tail tape measure protein, partial [Escherichia coli]|nr:phage tail tape measure protein [Escherichia coli]